MKRIILFSILILSNFMCAIAQDHTQELLNLLMRDDFISARVYHQNYKDNIDEEGEIFYKYKMSYYLNKLDSAAFYLEKFIKESPSFANNESEKLFLYNLLIGVYIDAENHRKLVDTYNDVEQLIENSAFINDAIWKKNQLMAISNFRNQAKMKLSVPSLIVTKHENEIEPVDLQADNAFITTNAEFNGVPLKTVFDTGNDYYIILSKNKADQCQFSDIAMQTDSIPLNGMMVRANYVMVDSIKVGSVLFKNVPALVLNDDNLSLPADTSFYSFDAIIGLPLMRQLGSISLDWEKKKMVLNVKEEVGISNAEPNMYFSNRKMYLGLTINNNDFVGFVDTGNCYSLINLNPDFYAKNSSSISLYPEEQERGIAGLTNVDRNAKYRFVRDANVIYDHEQIPLKEKSDCIVWLDKPMPEGLWRDGLIGLQFFKRLGSTIKFDFVNMRIVAE